MCWINVRLFSSSYWIFRFFVQMFCRKYHITCLKEDKYLGFATLSLNDYMQLRQNGLAQISLFHFSYHREDLFTVLGVFKTWDLGFFMLSWNMPDFWHILLFQRFSFNDNYFKIFFVTLGLTTLPYQSWKAKTEIDILTLCKTFLKGNFKKKWRTTSMIFIFFQNLLKLLPSNPKWK